jgi:hypothetical protein
MAYPTLLFDDALLEPSQPIQPLKAIMDAQQCVSKLFLRGIYGKEALNMLLNRLKPVPSR